VRMRSRLGGRRRSARRRIKQSQGALWGLRTWRARRMAPAQVPKTGWVAQNPFRASKKRSFSRNLSIVVDSPPGRMRASMRPVLPVCGFLRVCAGFGERGCVRGVVALDGEDADAGMNGFSQPILLRLRWDRSEKG